MAMVKCKECGNQISSKAPSCPNCGVVFKVENPKKKSSVIGGGCGCLLLIFLGVVFIIAINSSDKKTTPSTPQKPKTAAEKAKEKAEREEQLAIRKENMVRQKKHGKRPTISGWDGSCREVVKYLKAVAKDPDSVKIYRSSKVMYNDKEGWLIQCDWGAKNSFGAMNRSVNWFVIRNGQVAEMKQANAYQ